MYTYLLSTRDALTSFQTSHIMSKYVIPVLVSRLAIIHLEELMQPQLIEPRKKE
jgi:hypothetical protein